MCSAITRPRIVVGVDDSPASTVAVQWAARDAVLRDVALTVVHVAPPLSTTWSRSMVPNDLDTWKTSTGKQVVANAMEAAREATGDDDALQMDSEFYIAMTVPTLVDVSKRAQMIVVGSRGSGAVARVVLGSVSSALIRHAHCPVAVIKDDASLTAHAASLPVLVGIDGSPASDAATMVAFDEAGRRGVDLVALHAWNDFSGCDVTGPNWTAREQQAKTILAERLAGWQERHPGVSLTTTVVCDSPAMQLVAESKNAQLVVVGSHGRGGFAGMLIGSVSSAVAQAARVPVIVARRL